MTRGVRLWAFRLLAAGALTGFWVRGAASDLLWGVTHHWTATAGRASFPVPIGWREVMSPAGQHTIELRNTVRELLEPRRPDRILIQEAPSPFDPVEMAQRWEQLETERMIPGERLEPTPKDPFLRSHYRCGNVKRSANGRVTLTCFDQRGRWIVSLRGREQGIADLSKIMQGVSESAAVW